MEVYNGCRRGRGLSTECSNLLRVCIDRQPWPSYDSGVYRSGLGNLWYALPFYIEAGNAKLVLAASLVALITVHVYKNSILLDNLNDLEHVDYCWRILIGLGCVPGAIVLYFRLTIPETPRFTMDIDRDIQKARTDVENVLGPKGGSVGIYWVDPDAVVQRADAPRASRSDFFAQPGNLKLLFGAAYSWFSIDASPISYILNSAMVITDLRAPSTGRFLWSRSQFVFDIDFSPPYSGRDWLTRDPIGSH